MKTFIYTFLFSFLFCNFGYSQLNMWELDHIDYNQNLNDVWGWWDPDDGTEYGLVGTTEGLSIVSLADPENAVESAFFPLIQNSTWMDAKFWGEYVYATNESTGGLMVVDMTNHPDNITQTWWAPDVPGIGTLDDCHNIYIDEFGYIYLSGCSGSGVLIFDANANAEEPPYVATVSNIYSHDSFVKNNICFSSEIFDGTLGIYDVSDKDNIVQLASQQTPFNFTHNAWTNEECTIVLTTDEVGNAPVACYDISDLNNIVELDQYKPIGSLEEGVLPHNVMIMDFGGTEFGVISYYTDGGRIIDMTNPSNLIEVGNFDTWFGAGSGAWGIYPYLPSGLVLVTDIANGFYVLGVEYVSACWLEGVVCDEATGDGLNDVTVIIDSAQPNLGETDIFGEYQTGQVLAGTFDVTFTADGYNSLTVSVDLENGVLTELDVCLTPISSFQVTGQTIRTSNGDPVPDAEIVLLNDQYEFTATSDGSGNFTFPGVFGGEYTLFAGKWGYLTEAIYNVNIDNQTGVLVVTLDEGYKDDFILDLGWASTGNAATGAWERGEPNGTDFNGTESNPGDDVDFDLGNQCYVTGNGGGGAGNDDVDNGNVVLTSPIMDLSNYNQPTISYSRWFFNDGGNGNPNDELQVRLTNGNDEIILETIDFNTNGWIGPVEFDLTDLGIDLTENMQIIFETSDLQNSGHIVEGAVDAFLVIDESSYPVFEAASTTGCVPFEVTYTDFSDSTSVYAWSFEGGSPATSDQQNPVVMYNASGIYSVTLDVTTQSGNTYSITRSNYIEVNEAPTVDFNFNVAGNFVNFQNLSSAGSTYSWNFGDTNSSSADNPSHVYTEVGNYTVTLTAENDCGTTNLSQLVEITIVPPTAQFSVDATDGCTPFVVTYTDESAGNPDTRAWSFPGGNPDVSTDAVVAVTYDNPGNYSATLEVSNDAGSDLVVQSQFITVGQIPDVDYVYNNDNGTIIFTNLTQGDNVTYSWNFGDNTNSDEESPTHVYAEDGEYEVTLSASNECGTSAFTQTVTINISGIEYLEESNFNLSAFPNPFANELSVNYELKTAFEQGFINIYNAVGQQVEQIKIEEQLGEIELGNTYSIGLYFIRLDIDGKISAAMKVVKMK